MFIKSKKKGSVFVITLAISLILMVVGMAISNLVTNDFFLIKRLTDQMQAKFIAEAGIHHSVGLLADDFDLSIFPINGTITGGSYDVVLKRSGLRIMLESTGTVDQGSLNTEDDISSKAAIEINDASPSALFYIMSAGNNVKIRSIKDFIDINGKMHGNNRAHIQTAVGSIDISGTVTYSEETVELDVGGGALSINGITYGKGTHLEMDQWQDIPVSFPIFDYGYFKQLAIDSGSYYSGDTEFVSETLSPSGGIIYVDGKATFRGECHLRGSIIADEIQTITIKGHGKNDPDVIGEFFQHPSGILPYDFVVSKLGDITIGNRQGGVSKLGNFNTEACLVYSINDINIIGRDSTVNVTGCIAASGDINFWDFFAYLTYTHEFPAVDFGPNGSSMKIISWNI